MKFIKTLSIPILIILILIGLLLKYRTEIVGLENKINGLLYKVERESVLGEKYYTMLKLQIMHQNEQIDKDIIIFDKENFLSYKLFKIVNKDDLVLSIPENSCSDCIEKIVKALKNNKNYSFQRVVVLSVFFDKDEQSRFLKTRNISNKRWCVFNIDSKYFCNITNNRILLYKVNEENRFQDFIILDGEFDKLLETFLKFNL